MQDWNLSPLSIAAARDAWRELEAYAPRTPFLSHAWFDALVSVAGERAGLACYRIEAGAGMRAFGCIGRRRVRRAQVIPSRTLFLNQTGDPELDRLTLEHNGLAGSEETEPMALHALLTELLENDAGWDELSLGWLSAERWQALAPALADLPLHVNVIDRKPCYYVALDGIRGLDDYLAGLSRNTRYQIRRAIRGYGNGGSVRLEQAKDPEQAATWFRALVSWHQATWNARGRTGAFAGDFMQRFHEHLVVHETVSGAARVLRISGPEEPLGYLYNLHAGDYVCNYQSGFRYSEDPKLKPGLVGHALAIGRAATDGCGRYDFLMGDSQYKRSLANGVTEMLQIRLQRPRLRFRLERALHAWARAGTDPDAGHAAPGLHGEKPVRMNGRGDAG